MIARLVWTSLFCFLLAGIAAAQIPPNATLVVGNGEQAAQLAAGGPPQRITGRVSFDAILTENEAIMRGFNLAFFGVPQKMLAGDVPVSDPLGVLAFTLIASDAPQRLRFDPLTRQVSGTLKVTGDASFLIALAQPLADDEGDVFVPPDLSAVITVNLEVANDLPQPFGEYTTTALADFQVRSTDGSFRQFTIDPLDRARIRIDIGRIALYETERRLCIQPVRLERVIVDRLVPTTQNSGAGLAFGQPGADLQWAKADIAFTYRNWMTIPEGVFWKLEEKEAPALLTKVEIDDCIEIFFVYTFKPQGLWGGGATWGAGKASAQIITSDGNAREGRDRTHLAHELGHVLRLLHPNGFATPSRVPASTGTLMCGSGFKHDNPRVNSQENENLVANPLLTFSLKRRTPGPDCIDSSDCGPCP